MLGVDEGGCQVVCCEACVPLRKVVAWLGCPHCYQGRQGCLLATAEGSGQPLAVLTTDNAPRRSFCLPACLQRAEMESGEGGGPMVTEQDIANIVAQWTGIPIEKVGGRALHAGSAVLNVGC